MNLIPVPEIVLFSVAIYFTITMIIMLLCENILAKLSVIELVFNLLVSNAFHNAIAGNPPHNSKPMIFNKKSAGIPFEIKYFHDYNSYI